MEDVVDTTDEAIELRPDRKSLGETPSFVSVDLDGPSTIPMAQVLRFRRCRLPQVGQGGGRGPADRRGAPALDPERRNAGV
jgi:hypothetical protein